MIIEAILSFIAGFFGFFFDMLPTWDPIDLAGLWTSLDSGPGATIFGFFAWGNYYLPLTELLAISVLRLSLWAGVYIVRFVIWVLQLFHIAGGAS